MPVQRRLFGRPLNLRLPPRRFQIVFAVAFLLIILVLLSLQTHVPLPNVPTVSEIQQDAHRLAEALRKPKLSKLYNPFSPAAHEPLTQANSSQGDTRWYSDLKWLNPFSSAVTLDDDRTVLPPLNPRTPIYTFYNASGDKDPKVLEAENNLVLTWRRAWWAHGFKPIVLGPPEARKHPLYADVKTLKAPPNLEQDLERWLAWAHMGGGILANYLALPMAHCEHSQLSFLRKGEFSGLIKYESLHSGLLAGRSIDVQSAIRHMLAQIDLATKKPQNVLDSLPTSSFRIDQDSNGVAFYDRSVLASHSKKIVDALSESKADGLAQLQRLINAHLHNTWQNLFPHGIAILQPHAKGKAPLVEFATELGRDLAQCPDSPVPNSCPPNRPHCKPCEFSPAVRFSYPSAYANKSTIFTIGSIPHPYTFASLHYARSSLTSLFVRSETPRDMWLTAATETLLARGISGPQRLPGFKEAVAGARGRAQSLWLTAEREEFVDFDWIFGFALPIANRNSTVPTEAGSKKHEGSADPATQKQHDLFEAAKTLVKRRKQASVEMLEAWNMADVEAWKFVRAFQTRRRVERLAWEEEEKAFAGSEKRAKGWGKWIGV